MVKEVIHDPIFLAGKSELATKEDLQVVQDLLDTLIANKDDCVGMAANMIGVRKRITLDETDKKIFAMKHLGYTQKDIAEAVGFSNNAAVSKRLAIMKENFHKMLQ